MSVSGWSPEVSARPRSATVGTEVAKPPVFDLVTTSAGGHAVVAVMGDLDAATCGRLDDELVALVGGGSPRVTVDLAKLTFIGSSGLGTLVAAVGRMRVAGGDLRLQAPTPLALRVLELTGLSSLFAISAPSAPS